MKIIKLLCLQLVTLLLINCGNNHESSKNLFSIKIENTQKTYTTNDSFQVSVTNLKNKEIDSVVYFLNTHRLSSAIKNIVTNVSLSGQKLGKRNLLANVYVDGTSYDASKNITIVSSLTPKLYTYKILETYPHDQEAFTQGLEFKGDTLYESTGKYKASSLRKTNYQTGEVLQSIPLSDQYFGEGLNNKSVI